MLRLLLAHDTSFLPEDFLFVVQDRFWIWSCKTTLMVHLCTLTYSNHKIARIMANRISITPRKGQNSLIRFILSWTQRLWWWTVPNINHDIRKWAHTSKNFVMLQNFTHSDFSVFRPPSGVHFRFNFHSAHVTYYLLQERRPMNDSTWKTVEVQNHDG